MNDINLYDRLYDSIKRTKSTNNSFLIFVDDPEVKRSFKKNDYKVHLKYGKPNKKDGTALDYLIQYFKKNGNLEEEKDFFNDLLFNASERLSKICIRDTKTYRSAVTRRYIRRSFKYSPIIILGLDDDGLIRSFMTSGVKQIDSRVGSLSLRYLYVDVVCSCLKSEDLCPLSGNNRGPGGADLITILLHFLANLNNKKFKGVLLDAISSAEQAYTEMGFETTFNRGSDTVTMKFDLTDDDIALLRQKTTSDGDYNDINPSLLRDNRNRSRGISENIQQTRQTIIMASPTRQQTKQQTRQQTRQQSRHQTKQQTRQQSRQQTRQQNRQQIMQSRTMASPTSQPTTRTSRTITTLPTGGKKRYTQKNKKKLKRTRKK